MLDEVLFIVIVPLAILTIYMTENRTIIHILWDASSTSTYVETEFIEASINPRLASPQLVNESHRYELAFIDTIAIKYRAHMGTEVFSGTFLA